MKKRPKRQLKRTVENHDPDNELQEKEKFKERMLIYGDVVYSRTYDSDFPGGSGFYCVYEYPKKKFYFYDGENWPVGPYDSLEKALAENPCLTRISQATEAVTCWEMDTSELLERLWAREDDPGGWLVEINRRMYVYCADIKKFIEWDEEEDEGNDARS